MRRSEVDLDLDMNMDTVVVRYINALFDPHEFALLLLLLLPLGY